MNLFDEKGITDIDLSEQAKIERIEFNNVSLFSEESSWSADIAVDIFDSNGETPSGIIVGIFLLGKRVGSASTDDWGNAIFKIKNLSVPESRETPVRFEARIKGQAVRAWSDELDVPMTIKELKTEKIRIEKEKEHISKAEEERKSYLKAKIRESGFLNIDNRFYLCDHQTTQEEYYEIMMDNQSRFQGKNNPVERVSWFDAVNYCNERSKREGFEPVYSINGKDVTWDDGRIGYRLPTEAEWEYAARGGSRSKGYIYSGSDNIDEVAWYGGNSSDKTHPVKGKRPNELGLYDMSGNVYEWCRDCFQKKTHRMVCGGSWGDSAEYCTVSYRREDSSGGRSYYIGFRVALSHFKSSLNM